MRTAIHVTTQQALGCTTQINNIHTLCQQRRKVSTIEYRLVSILYGIDCLPECARAETRVLKAAKNSKAYFNRH
jgi:hypothetical protein